MAHTDRINRFLACLAALVLMHGCGGDAAPDSGQPKANAVLMQGVQLLDAATQQAITASDATTLTFVGAPAKVAALVPGDIVIVGELARKVVAVQAAGGSTVVQTTSPEFSEVFKTLQISASVLLTDNLRVPAAAPARARALRETRQAVSVGSSGSLYTVTLQHGPVTGTVTIDQPQVDVRFNYGVATREYASVHFKAAETFDLQIAATADIPPQSIDIPLLSFEVPIVVTGGTVKLNLALSLHVGADGSAILVAAVQQRETLDAGIEATIEPFDVKVTNATTHTFTVTPPQFKGEISAVVSLNPTYDIEVLQYAIAGMGNSLGVRANATATATLDNACERLKVEGFLAADAYIMLPHVALSDGFSWDTFLNSLDLSMQKVEAKLFDLSDPLYDSGDVCVVTNQPPIADAGANASVAPGASVVLDGNASRDTDGTIVAYAWAQTAGTTVTLSSTNTPTAAFIAPAAAGTLAFRLTVTDDAGASASKDVVITVTAPPAGPPLPAAPADLSVQSGDAQLTLGWAPVSGADAYAIYYATVAGVGPFNYAALAGGTKIAGATSPQVIAGLANGVAYHLVVTALNASGEGLASQEAVGTPHATVTSGGAQRHPTLALSIDTGCVVLRDGTVRCWGYGPVGDGKSSFGSITPVPVAGVSNAIEVSAGVRHMCALLADTTVRCWGSNQFRQLGDGSTVPTRLGPVTVVGLSGAVSLASGDNHTCALLRDGTARCWGDDQATQLGVPTPVGLFVTAPTLMPGVSNPVALEAAMRTTCIVDADNRVRCYGAFGGIAGGLPALADQGVSGAVAVAVESGNLCALLGDGSAACWGINSAGVLGNGTTTSSPTPVPVSGLTGATWISGGQFAAHHCALLAGGSLKCWGDNSSGQLGTGSFSNTSFSNVPVPVVGVANAVTVAGTYRATCVVIDDGTVKCWGERFWVGVDGALATAVPEAVAGISTAR